jgi:hypothetical protein
VCVAGAARTADTFDRQTLLLELIPETGFSASFNVDRNMCMVLRTEYATMHTVLFGSLVVESNKKLYAALRAQNLLATLRCVNKFRAGQCAVGG